MDFIQRLPKIELHAHLNGSLSNDALLKLLALKSNNRPIEPEFYKITSGESINLNECFLKFKYAHDLTTTREAIKLATSCMIADFAKENTIYLEIRSTPKENENLTRAGYLEAIVEAIQEAPASILVKLIASINRADGLNAARDNVKAAIEIKEKFPQILVGMDISGDPTKFTFEDFKPFLKEARLNGLKMALHCAEVTENFEDVKAILEFGPERIGHGTFIQESDKDNWKLLREKKPLVECCLTSNVKCGTVKTYDDHHFAKLYEIGHPVSICTDDFGVFDTNLTREIGLTAAYNTLSNKNLVDLMKTAVDYCFASPEEKEALKGRLDFFCNQNVP